MITHRSHHVLRPHVITYSRAYLKRLRGLFLPSFQLQLALIASYLPVLFSPCLIWRLIAASDFVDAARTPPSRSPAPSSLKCLVRVQRPLSLAEQSQLAT
jgi:hypothetical protein